MDRRDFIKVSAASLASIEALAAQSATPPDGGNFVDFTSLNAPTEFKADICIIGAGPAGITLALELADSGKSVLMVHGGGDTASENSQAFFQGTTADGSRPYPIGSSRLNALGGASGHWSGWCSPLSPMDFANRSWVSDSGWPLSYDEVHPYYERAHRYFLLENPPYYSSSHWLDQYPELPEFDSGKILTNIWQFSSPPVNFGKHYQEDLTKAPSLKIIQNAQVTELRTLQNKTSVETAFIQSSDGRQGTVSANKFVLACGGIENARLLLASNQDNPRGLGNSNDLVGRYFMEHLESKIGKLSSFDAERMRLIKRKTLQNNTTIGSVFCLSELEQRKHSVGNGAAFIAAPSFGGQQNGWTSLIALRESLGKGKFPENLGEKLWEMVRDFDTLVGVAAHIAQGKEVSTRISRKGSIDIISIAEQTPNAESRVTLSTQSDPLGNPLAELTWKINQQDKHTIQKTVQLLADEFKNSNTSDVVIAEWLKSEPPGDWPESLRGGSHHIGTTKMSDSPRAGVVDKNCRMHELNNLYVAGSSVFPTGGYATPTVTIVALAIKLADHLKTHT